MLNKLWYLLGLFIGIVGLLFTPLGVSAATEPEEGFKTFSNPETSTEALAWCENSVVQSVAVLAPDDTTYTVGAPLGASCDAESFGEGFIEAKINLNPFDSWVIAPERLAWEGTEVAYTCTPEGVTFAIKNPGEPLFVHARPGPCSPGVVPG